MSKQNALPVATKAVLSVASPFRRGGDAAGLPQRVKILGWGENIGRTTGARILVDDAVAATLCANQELVACDSVPMDYEHQSVQGHPNYVPDPRYSPGAGKIEVVPGEGIYLSAITYTANGEELADSYQDVSAVVHLSKEGRPLWISSVALTQRGDVAGMELTESIAVLSAQNPTTYPTPDPTIMEDKKENPHRALLLKLLGLKPEATEEELTAAAAKMGDGGPAAETVALSAFTAMEARLKLLEGQSEESKRDALVAQATRDGKVIPLSAEVLKITPIAVLSALVDGLKAGEVPLDVKASKEKTDTKTVALSADEKAAAKSLGLTEDAYQAAKG